MQSSAAALVGLAAREQLSASARCLRARSPKVQGLFLFPLSPASLSFCRSLLFSLTKAYSLRYESPQGVRSSPIGPLKDPINSHPKCWLFTTKCWRVLALYLGPYIWPCVLVFICQASWALSVPNVSAPLICYDFWSELLGRAFWTNPSAATLSETNSVTS